MGYFFFTIFCGCLSFAHVYASNSENEGTILNNLGKKAYCFKDVVYQNEKYICEQVVMPGETCQGDALGFYINDRLTIYKAPNAYLETENGAQFECGPYLDTFSCNPSSDFVKATTALGELYGQAKIYFSWDDQTPIQESVGGVENIYGFMSASYFFDLIGGAKDGNRVLSHCQGYKPTAPSLVVRDIFKQLEEQGKICERSQDAVISQFVEQARHGRTTLDVIIKIYNQQDAK